MVGMGGVGKKGRGCFIRRRRRIVLSLFGKVTLVWCGAYIYR